MENTSRQRGERRRRIMIDQGRNHSDASGRQPNAVPRLQVAVPREDFGNYTEEALAERQPRLCDLIPSRMRTLGCMLFGGAAAIAGLEWIFVRLWETPGIFSHQQLAPFDPVAPGSLASWLGSAFLTLAAFLAAQVYLLRRHRHDDYRGYYRGWLWVVAMLIAASLDAVTGLHRLLPPAMHALTGTPVYGDGTVWWMLVVVSLAAACTFRSISELRHSPPAMVAFGIALTGYGLAALVTLELLLLAIPVEQQMVVSSASSLCGHFGLLMALACYGRHVYLDAQGSRRIGRRDSRIEVEEPQRTTSPEHGPVAERLHIAPSPEPETQVPLTVHRSTEPKQQSAQDREAPGADSPATELPQRPRSKSARRRRSKQQRRRKAA